MGQGAILDGDTFALWRFDEAEGPMGIAAGDSAPGVRDLAFATQVDGVILRNAPGAVGAGAQLIWPNGQSPARIGRATDNALRTVLKGSYTLEMWVTRTASPDAMNFFCHTIDSAYPKPSTADHDLLIVQCYPDGTVAALWTSPSGGDLGELIAVNSTVNAIPLGVRTHVAIRKTVDGGDPTQCTLAIFINGVENQAQGPGYRNVSQASDAGSNGSLWIGAYASDWSWPMEGALDDVRLSNVARSDAEILETYNRGIATGGGGGTAPEVTLITPMEGPLPERSAIVFEVTDADDDLAEVFASIDYEGTGLTEAVLDAEGFTQGFAQASTRETITHGFRYTVRRAGVWPQVRATLKVTAVDSNGNVG